MISNNITCELNVPAKRLLGRVEETLAKSAKHVEEVEAKLEKYKPGGSVSETEGSPGTSQLHFLFTEELRLTHEEIHNLKNIAILLSAAVDEPVTVTFQL